MLFGSRLGISLYLEVTLLAFGCRHGGRRLLKVNMIVFEWTSQPLSLKSRI